MKSTSDVKFKLKTASFEVEYEGSEQFLQNKLSEIGEAFSNLDFKGTINTHNEIGTENLNVIKNKKPVHYKSTTDIAAKLKVKSGTDLAVAAMAKLQFVDGKDEYDRKEILTEMKTAKSFYNKNYSPSLSKTFETLQKNSRVQTSGKMFSLSHAEIDTVKGKLNL